MTRVRVAPRIVAFLVAAAACGADRPEGGERVVRCRERCEDAKGCPDASPTTKATDCPVACDDVEAINFETDCYGPFDDLDACIDRKGVCAADEACGVYRATYEDCVADNCSADRDDCAL